MTGREKRTWGRIGATVPAGYTSVFTLQPSSVICEAASPDARVTELAAERAGGVEAPMNDAGTPASIGSAAPQPSLVPQTEIVPSLLLPGATVEDADPSLMNKAKNTKQRTRTEVVDEDRATRFHQAPTPVQPRASKRSRPAMARESPEVPAAITPAAVDNFISKAVPVFPVPLPKEPETPRGPSRRSRSTPPSGGTLDYVTPARERASSRERLQQTPSFDGSPLDLR